MGGMFEKLSAGFLYFLANFDWSVNFRCPLCKIVVWKLTELGTNMHQDDLFHMQTSDLAYNKAFHPFSACQNH